MFLLHSGSGGTSPAFVFKSENLLSTEVEDDVPPPTIIPMESNHCPTPSPSVQIPGSLSGAVDPGDGAGPGQKAGLAQRMAATAATVGTCPPQQDVRSGAGRPWSVCPLAVPTHRAFRVASAAARQQQLYLSPCR